MKAAVVHDFAAPPRFGDFAEPLAAAGEVLVQVQAAALSQLVRAQAAGKHYSSGSITPIVPGVDGVGRLDDGRRVYFAFPRMPFGALAQLTVVPEANCVALPDEVDDATAAAIANPGMSSWVALTERAGFRRGENVLINGAAGASGRLAIQIAKHLGAGRVIVTARNARSLEGLQELGADTLVALDQPPEQLTRRFRELLRGEPVDVVLDYLWGQSAECLLAAAAGHGSREAERRLRYVQIGSISGHVINFPGALLRSSGLELMGSGLGSVSNAGLVRAVGDVLGAVKEAGLAIATESAPLAHVASEWTRETTRRLVFHV